MTDSIARTSKQKVDHLLPSQLEEVRGYAEFAIEGAMVPVRIVQMALREIDALEADYAHLDRYWQQFDHYPKGEKRPDETPVQSDIVKLAGEYFVERKVTSFNAQLAISGFALWAANKLTPTTTVCPVCYQESKVNEVHLCPGSPPPTGAKE